jgi:hypothetical protein
MSKSYILTYILVHFYHNCLCTATMPTPPPARFYCYTDHLRAGEVLLGCDPQSSVATVKIPNSFRSWVTKSAGGGGFSVVPTLSLSMWTAGATSFWTFSRNHSALLHICQIPGEVNLHLMKARSKLSRHPYLKGFWDPGSIRVNNSLHYFCNCNFAQFSSNLSVTYAYDFLQAINNHL